MEHLNERLLDINNLLDGEWNIHILRKCAKSLTQIDKKTFKLKRFMAYARNDHDSEKNILKEMIIDKCKEIDDNQYNTFKEKLIKYSELKRFHPMKKFNLPT
jgi:hypothetical protein